MTQPFFAYMLQCRDGRYYLGHTDNIELRLAQHNEGSLGGYTATRRPVELVWSEQFQTRDDAFRAERRIKGWSRAKKEALIRGDWTRVSALASRAEVPRVLRDAGKPAPQEERPLLCSAHPEEDRRSVSKDHPGEGRRPVSKDHSEEGRRPVSKDAPLIILVRPQLGENIGKAARAMLNFGLTELRLVSPRDGWPNPAAGPAAAGADAVLARAEVFPTLAAAVHDCAHVYATTVRRREVTKPVLTPAEAALAIHREPGRSALVFGPERSGLETDDVALARAIVTVPINPAFASLNLAQAVILCAYEWSKHEALAQPPAEDLLPPAPQAELEQMIVQLEAMLEPAGYFRPPSRAVATHRTLRTMLTKPGWNHLEVRTLRGVLAALARGPRDD